MSLYKTAFELTVWLVGSNRKIQLPAQSQLDIEAETPDKAVVTTPPELEGVVFRIQPEHRKALVAVVGPKSNTDVDKKLDEFRKSIAKCISKIVDDFDKLPEVRTSTPTHIARDLGPVVDWVDDVSCVRNWMHHVNMAIPHHALSVEKAMLGNELHFVLLLNQAW